MTTDERLPEERTAKVINDLLSERRELRARIHALQAEVRELKQRRTYTRDGLTEAGDLSD